MGTKKTEKKRSTKAASGRKKGARKEDQRNDQRIPVQLLVDYHSDGTYLFDFCKDLGTGGVFIETANPLASGSTVDLTFTIPDSKETLSAKGEVIWVQNAVAGRDLTPGMGVQFTGFSSQQREVLENFLQRYHESPPVESSSDRSA